MKKSYFNKLHAFLFVCCFLSSSLSLAQSKAPQSSWYGIKLEDSYDWKELDEENRQSEDDKKIKVRDPNWYIKNSCVPEDLLKTKERRSSDQVMRMAGVSYGIADKIVDESGKVQVAYMYASSLQGYTMIKWLYFRDKSECLKEQQAFKERIIVKSNAFLERSAKVRKKYD